MVTLLLCIKCLFKKEEKHFSPAQRINGDVNICQACEKRYPHYYGKTNKETTNQ